MKILGYLLIVFFAVSCKTHFGRTPSAEEAATDVDKYQWLEDIESPRALDWVKARNEKTFSELKKDLRYRTLEKNIRKILLAKDRIPGPEFMGDFIYNFWQDEKNVRGIWRRTSIKEYTKKSPKWETVLDLDELSRKEEKNWVWKSAQCLEPFFEQCLISLSNGGKDAVTVREFNTQTKLFLQNGFVIPEAKSNASWVDANTLMVSTDFGPDSLTDSGYPRMLKVWKRGDDLTKTPVTMMIKKKDLGLFPMVSHRPEGTRLFIVRALSFYESEIFHLPNISDDPIKIDIPLDSETSGVFQGQLILKLLSDWKTKSGNFISGSVVSVDLQDTDQVKLIYSPDERSAFSSLSILKDFIAVVYLENVRSKLVAFSLAGKEWKKASLPVSEKGSVDIASSQEFSNSMYIRYEDFLTPTTLFQVNVEKLSSTKIKQIPKRFNPKGLVANQFFATSKDGTSIPYFIIHRNNLELDGKNPTILYGYGGFLASMTPSYLKATGKAWSEQGGVYVIANIRGGGEFGPRWHQAALLKNRQKAFDDFQAVAKDLIARKITSPKHLGIMGGSNGGLLMGVSLTQAPELFNAVVAQVPLLDMLRYHHLLAGASWMGEYGNPDDPEMNEVIRAYSPYQNVKPNVKYPKTLFVTSTKDDRVHPGHARKMAARLEEIGAPYLLFENTDGGHAASANIEETIQRTALQFNFFYQQLF